MSANTRPMARAAARRRPPGRGLSLWPKEHGAYAELTFPLLTGLLIGSPSAVSFLLTAATIAGFLLHEPALVLTGARGSRVNRVLGNQARVRAAWLAAALLSLGGGALWLSDADTRWAMVAPVAMATLLIPVVAAKREKTALGELLAAAAFSAALLPVAVAGGVATSRALLAMVAWTTTFAVGTFAVRLTLERARKERGLMRIVSPAFSSATILGAVVSTFWLGTAPLAALPTAIAGLLLFAWPVSAKRLRTLGWALVAGNVLVFALLVVTLRG